GRIRLPGYRRDGRDPTVSLAPGHRKVAWIFLRALTRLATQQGLNHDTNQPAASVTKPHGNFFVIPFPRPFRLHWRKPMVLVASDQAHSCCWSASVSATRGPPT